MNSSTNSVRKHLDREGGYSRLPEGCFGAFDALLYAFAVEGNGVDGVENIVSKSNFWVSSRLFPQKMFVVSLVSLTPACVCPEIKKGIVAGYWESAENIVSCDTSLAALKSVRLTAAAECLSGFKPASSVEAFFAALPPMGRFEVEALLRGGDLQRPLATYSTGKNRHNRLTKAVVGG